MLIFIFGMGILSLGVFRLTADGFYIARAQRKVDLILLSTLRMMGLQWQRLSQEARRMEEFQIERRGDEAIILDGSIGNIQEASINLKNQLRGSESRVSSLLTVIGESNGVDRGTIVWGSGKNPNLKILELGQYVREKNGFRIWVEPYYLVREWNVDSSEAIDQSFSLSVDFRTPHFNQEFRVQSMGRVMWRPDLRAQKNRAMGFPASWEMGTNSLYRNGIYQSEWGARFQ